MKTLVLLSVAVLCLTFVNSASHSRHHEGKSAKDHGAVELETADGDWPSPGNISDFGVPDVFTGSSGGVEQEPGSGDENPPGKHHGKSRHRSHKN